MNSRLPGAVVLACLLAFGLAGSVAAHAELIESDPAETETIETPYQLTARFSEPLAREGSRVVVRNAAGDEVARGGPRPGDPTLIIVELPELPQGQYVARWTAVTPDDLGVTRGTISFRIDVLTHTPVPPTDPSATTSPTAGPTPNPTPGPSPAASPEPGDGQPTAGMTDVLLALVLAGVVIAAIALYLLRRR